MPANTAIIGRVAVKVLPDTTDFRRDAERKLNAEEKNLPPITISTKIDMTGALRGALEELRKINAENRIKDSRKIRFYTEISSLGMNEEVSKAVRRLNERARLRKVKFDADINDIEAHVDVADASLKEATKKLEHWRRANDPLKIGVKLDISQPSSRVASTKLGVLARTRDVNLKPKIDKTAYIVATALLDRLSGARVIRRYFDEMFDSIKNLDKAAPIIGSLALAVAGLAGWGLSASANLFALAQSLAQIGPAALALPGIFTGIGIGLGITLLALKDMKKVLPDVYTAFQKMHQQVSKNFWDQAAKPIRALALEFLPHLAETATQVGRFWGQMAAELQKPFRIALDTMFANLHQSINIATGGTKQFAGIITQLGLTGSQYLPRLAQWFVDISTKFNQFLAKATADGRLQAWIDTAITRIKELASVLGGVGRLFSGLSRIASLAGGSSLASVGTALDSIVKAINTPAFQKDLVSVLQAASSAMASISGIAGPGVVALFHTLSGLLTSVLPTVGVAIGTALNAIGSALAQPAVQSGLTDLFNGILTAVLALAPAMAPLGQVIGSVASIIGTFLASVGPTFSTLLQAVANAALLLLPSIQQIIPPLAQMLNDGLLPLLPVLPVVATTLAGLLPILAGLVTSLTPLIPLIVAGFAAWKLWTTALSFAKLIIDFGVLVASMTETVALQALYAKDAIVKAAQVAAAWAASIAETVALWALYAVQAAASAASAALAWVTGAAQTIAANVAAAASFVANGVIMVAQMAVTAASVVAGWVLMGVQSLLNAARVAAAWLIAMGPIGIIIAAVIALVVVIVKNWEAIKNAIVGAATFVLNWVKSHWPLLLTILTGPIGLVVSLLAKHWTSIKNAVKEAVEWVISKFTSFIAFFATLPGKIGSAIAGLAGTIVAPFKTAFNAVARLWNGTVGKLSFKAPSWLPGIGGKGFSVPKIPQLASGGFIPKTPGGVLANIGEGSLDEMVLPLPSGLKPAKLARILGQLADGTAPSGQTKVLNYYAAEGSSINSEEDLFAASDRARMVGW